jgi:hypothetical protein
MQGAERRGGPFPAPRRRLPAFPDAERDRPKTPRQGGAGLRPRWRDRGTGRIYEWDSRHGTVEVYDDQGRHIGEFHPSSGKQLKGPNPNYASEPIFADNLGIQGEVQSTGLGSHETPRWRGESAANSSRKMPNSLLAGNIQGISGIREFHRFGPRRRVKGSQKRYQISTLRANSLSIRTGNFLPPYRELNRAIRVIFAPIRESRCRPLFRQQPCRQIVSSRQISNIAEKAEQGRRQMLGVAEADLQLEGGFVRVKGAPGMRKSLAELVDANDRRSGASRWRVVASRAARVHRAHRRRGTEGSNPYSLQR